MQVRRWFVVLVVLVISSGIQPSVFAQSHNKFSPGLRRVVDNRPTSPVLCWIYFTDKGDDIAQKLKTVEANLNAHAYQRRLRNRTPGNLVDYYDVPLKSEYVQEVAAHVIRVRHKSRWLNAVSVEATPPQLNELATFPFVRKLDLVFTATAPLPIEVNPAPVVTPYQKPGEVHSFTYGPSFDQDNQINVILLHDMGLSGAGVVIAMLDAGFNNLQHEAFQQLTILHTWDFVNGDSNVSDEPGQMGNGNHGTYTLSTLGGFKEGQLIGPAFGASFLLAKTENTDSERHIEEDNWVAGAEWADSLGADIISSSLGYLNFDPGEGDYTWQDMDGNTTIVTIGADIAASRGILVVNSAGNEGPASPPENTLVAPADGDSVLAVGAVNAGGLRASFSSMGPTADGRIKPDVMARGVATYCASPNQPDGYVTVSGTSLSCPLAAGAAALVLQANPSITNMQIIDALHQTASQANNPDNQFGWGIINAYDAATLFSGLPGEDNIPTSLELYPVYPNPFNATTTIRFFLPETSTFRVDLYNLRGQRVTTLREGMESGFDIFRWDASAYPSGVYFIVLSANGRQKAQKAVLVK